MSYALHTAGITASQLAVDLAAQRDGEEGLCLPVPCNFTAPLGTDLHHFTGTWWRGKELILHSSKRLAVWDHYLGRVAQWTGFRKGLCSLVIQDLRVSDSGVYTITVQDKDLPGSASFIQNVKVKVIGKPTISLTPESIEEGGTLVLTCESERNPPANVSLHRFGETQSLKQGLTTELSLTLFNVTRQDSGEYTCLFQHGQEIQNASIQVIVMYGPEITDGSGCTDSNGMLVCVCLSQGFPTPTLEWLNLRVNSNLLSIVNSAGEGAANSTITLQNSTSLTVVCVGRNRIGEACSPLLLGDGQSDCETIAMEYMYASYAWAIVGFFLNVPIIFLIFCIYLAVDTGGNGTGSQREWVVQKEEQTVDEDQKMEIPREGRNRRGRGALSKRVYVPNSSEDRCGEQPGQAALARPREGSMQVRYRGT
ncbi:hypothetical protein AAFF_G00328890 [Aldrovandia affinis]|uniref:Ig-like domain-containing protein n=1 Tax=Aldrovandia affinis TaxID=143900 RepID=A0AAD7WQ74_9TELE|nr:hypothetical protein AAFF_G00328890 [Aldrovandia affinis]